MPGKSCVCRQIIFVTREMSKQQTLVAWSLPNKGDIIDFGKLHGVVSSLFVCLSLIADLLYMAVNPRLRTP